MRVVCLPLFVSCVLVTVSRVYIALRGCSLSRAHICMYVCYLANAGMCIVAKRCGSGGGRKPTRGCGWWRDRKRWRRSSGPVGQMCRLTGGLRCGPGGLRHPQGRASGGLLRVATAFVAVATAFVASVPRFCTVRILKSRRVSSEFPKRIAMWQNRPRPGRLPMDNTIDFESRL